MVLLAKIDLECEERTWHETYWTHVLRLLLTLKEKKLIPSEIFYQGVFPDKLKQALEKYSYDLLGVKGQDLKSLDGSRYALHKLLGDTDAELKAPLKSSSFSLSKDALYILDEANFTYYQAQLGIDPGQIPTKKPTFCELYCLDNKGKKSQLTLVPLVPAKATKQFDRRQGSVGLVPPFLPSDAPSSKYPGAVKYTRLAIADSITGLPKPERHVELMQEFYELCSAQEGVLVLLDVDHMAKLNDDKSIGYAGVDVLLGHIGEAINERTRDTDLKCRYRGDEFLVFLVDCSQSDAKNVVKRVQDYLSELLHKDPASPVTTLSAGVSSYHTASKIEFARAFREAELALDRAKKEENHHGGIGHCTIQDSINVFKEISVATNNPTKKSPHLRRFEKIFGIDVRDDNACMSNTDHEHE
ncbi:MAG: GGDEF domain-containing protein [Alphaproteobacteria bacterium]|nr:GGDEF domain-containing protein [Alphaproteobacteria bacterium]